MPIAASQLVSVNPGVISAGGSGLVMNGMCLTTSYRVPIGANSLVNAVSFPTAAAVAAYFGSSSTEAAIATQYFKGYLNSTKKPGLLYFAQYPAFSGVPAYLQGANVASLTLNQLQQISGTLIVTIDGITFTSSAFNLGSAGSFSAAATIIQTALAAVDVAATGSIAPAVAITASTSTISGSTLTVATVSSGSIVPNAVLTGSGVAAGTTVLSQLTGTTGAAGTYQVSISQTTSATTITATNAAQGIMTLSAVASGTVQVGQNVTGTGVTAGTTVTGMISGTGTTGTYIVSASQTVSSESLSLGVASVDYDSVSGGFQIFSGLSGSASSITVATGTAATALGLSAAAGAVASQGSNAAAAITFMNSLVSRTTNWFSFFLAFTPSDTVKENLAQWTDGQDVQYLFIMPDADATLITNSYAASAWGVVQAAGYDGTLPIYNLPNSASPLAPDWIYAAAVSGFFAALDFTALNGRQTLAYRQSPALPFVIGRSDWSAQLLANGVNFYGTYASANENFTWWQNGTVSGEFLWADSYAQAVYLKNQLQLALLTLLGAVGNIPYNAQGAALIEAACIDPITQMVNYGGIRPGVTLSALQIAEVNNAAGVNIAPTLFSAGWYLQVLTLSTTSQVRAARGSPPISLWYVDGQSVQQINVASIQIQ